MEMTVYDEQRWNEIYEEAYDALIADGCPPEFAGCEAEYEANIECGLIPNPNY